MSRTINYIALPVLLVAAYLEIYWIWGLLFIWWAVPSVLTGTAFLTGEIRRERDPFLFWAVVALWGIFGAMMVAASLFPQYAGWLV